MKEVFLLTRLIPINRELYTSASVSLPRTIHGGTVPSAILDPPFLRVKCHVICHKHGTRVMCRPLKAVDINSVNGCFCNGNHEFFMQSPWYTYRSTNTDDVGMIG